MEKKSILAYVFFGTCVRYLQDATSNSYIFERGYVMENINTLFSNLKEMNLIVTSNAAFKLSAFRDELSKIKDKKAKLTDAQAQELHSISNQLRGTLEAELEAHEVFVVTPKRYDLNKLLDDIGSLMSPGVFTALPDNAKYDITEAGKCIAFERPTAAAFHLLRGTEAVLRKFYCTLVHTKKVPNLLWGDMTNDLRTRQRTKTYTTLYNNLDNIRHSYRNPTQHPDAIYDIHEVQDLCPLCFEVINRMMKILSKDIITT